MIEGIIINRLRGHFDGWVIDRVVDSTCTSGYTFPIPSGKGVHFIEHLLKFEGEYNGLFEEYIVPSKGMHLILPECFVEWKDDLA